jgi:glycosyltransferase involved in cell wall biosynthesis
VIAAATLLAPDCLAPVTRPRGRVGRRLRVLQFAYGERLYGAERWVLTLIKHLDPAKVQTTVGCLLDADSSTLALIDEAKRLGFETRVIEARRNLIGSATRGLRAAIRSRGIDIVHSHGVRQDVLTLLASRGLPVKIVSTSHGWEARCSLKERARMLVNKAAFVGFDAVAPLSEDLRESVRIFPVAEGRVHLIQNGVDLSEVDTARPVEGPLPGQTDPGDFVIGYIGQLIRRKGVEVLLEALSRLPASGWSCSVIGEGPERERLIRLAERLGLGARVTFLGYRQDRLSYLKRFNLFVLPSFREGIPRCLMEALAAGVPCIGSRIPGIEAVLRDGLTGDTFPPGDSRTLAECIVRCEQDPEGARRKAAAGRALVRGTFSAEAMARAYERLYRSLACEQRRS